MAVETKPYVPKNHIRVVTAASLFDGHDAAINIIRRILQGTGVEVIHLGHNRSVKDIVKAAVAEDVHAIGASCYQGGHVEFFKYMVDLLKERNCSHIKVFGGGGGVIIPEEIKELEGYGVFKIYSPEDGRKMGLQGIINHLVRNIDKPIGVKDTPKRVAKLSTDHPEEVARVITCVERAALNQDPVLDDWRQALNAKMNGNKVPVIGITGTGGSGKSSLTDELMIRLLQDFEKVKVAIISVDPTRRKTGGALLGDRIRMNSLTDMRIYLRSLATRGSGMEISGGLLDVVNVAKAAGYNLVLVETAGIGQGDAAVIDYCDLSLYVMTSEFGAASQLEKIDMLDFADLVAINKFDRRGAEDALRDVRKQIIRNRGEWHANPESMPVYGTIASKFNDDGVTALYLALLKAIKDKTGLNLKSPRKRTRRRASSSRSLVVPAERTSYLGEIADTVRAYHRQTRGQADLVRRVWQMKTTHDAMAPSWKRSKGLKLALDKLRREVHKLEEGYTEQTHQLLDHWNRIQKDYSGDEYRYKVRGKEFKVPLNSVTLSGTKIPKVAVPANLPIRGTSLPGCARRTMPAASPIPPGSFP
jgi:methylmalonyl-CoA mutase